jgi:hypothetical protein
MLDNMVTLKHDYIVYAEPQSPIHSESYCAIILSIMTNGYIMLIEGSHK